MRNNTTHAPQVEQLGTTMTQARKYSALWRARENGEKKFKKKKLQDQEKRIVWNYHQSIPPFRFGAGSLRKNPSLNKKKPRTSIKRTERQTMERYIQDKQFTITIEQVSMPSSS